MALGLTPTTLSFIAGNGSPAPSAGVTDVLQNGSSVVENGVARVTVPVNTSDLQNDSGFITSSDIPAIPTKTSDLQNDSGFVTSSAIPTKTSELQNDSGFVTSSAIPTKTSDLQNDSGFVTAGEIRQLPASTSADSGEVLTVDSQGNPGWAQLPSPVVGGVQDVTVDGVSVVSQGVAAITMPSVPTKTSQLQNDSGFVTSSAIPTKTSDLQNDSGFITSSSLPTVDQTYNAASTNAQSGVAVAQAIAGITPGGSGASLKYHAHLVNTSTDTVVSNITTIGSTITYPTGIMYTMPAAKANDVLIGGNYTNASGIIRMMFEAGTATDGENVKRFHLFVGDPRNSGYRGFHSMGYPNSVNYGNPYWESAAAMAPFLEVPYYMPLQVLSYTSPVEIYVFFEDASGHFFVPQQQSRITFFKFV